MLQCLSKTVKIKSIKIFCKLNSSCYEIKVWHFQMCSYFHSRRACLYQEAASWNGSSHRDCKTPSIESLAFCNVCHYFVSGFGHERAKPDQRWGRSVLLTHEGEKRTKSITHISHRKFSQCFFFCPAIQTSNEKHKPFLSQTFQSQAKRFCQFKLGCTMWLSSLYLDQPANSPLILILYLKLEESLSWPSLFLV